MASSPILILTRALKGSTSFLPSGLFRLTLSRHYRNFRMSSSATQNGAADAFVKLFPTEDGIETAGRMLREGKCVAFPTGELKHSGEGSCRDGFWKALCTDRGERLLRRRKVCRPNDGQEYSSSAGYHWLILRLTEKKQLGPSTERSQGCRILFSFQHPFSISHSMPHCLDLAF